jgi:hypothetical protein
MSSDTGPAHEGITAAGLSKEDQNINNSVEDKSHQAAGHKANLSNPSKHFLYHLNFDDSRSIFRSFDMDTDIVARHKRRVKEEVRASSQGTRW